LACGILVVMIPPARIAFSHMETPAGIPV
jgi:hypothetical protein